MLPKSPSYVLLLIFLQLVAAAEVPNCPYCGVEDLSAEGDFRAVKLTWRFARSLEPPAFRIKYCETSQWHLKGRCRQKILPLARAIHGKGKYGQKDLPPQLHLGRLIRMEKGSYQTKITDLRMITNYSFSVEAEFHEWQESARPYFPAENEVFPVAVETKGFTGHTIKCLGNSSEVAVNTGPYFNGKISVEGALNESCFLYGNRSSPQEVYTMTIHHVSCGSKIMNNSIETMIVVHENREILTHNSRRFLVVCNFPHEYFNLTASVEVPPHLLNRKKTKHETESIPRRKPLPPVTDEPNYINFFDKYKFSRLRDSRIDDDELNHQTLKVGSTALKVPIFIVAGVMLVTGIVAWSWKTSPTTP